MKNRTIGKEPVSIGKMDRCHFPVNQHFVTNRYKNGRFDRGFWNPSYKMLGERVVPQVFVTILLQKAGSRSLVEIAIKMRREISIRAHIFEGECDQGRGKEEGEYNERCRSIATWKGIAIRIMREPGFVLY